MQQCDLFCLAYEVLRDIGSKQCKPGSFLPTMIYPVVVRGENMIKMVSLFFKITDLS
jgi:hypothetical protein